MGGGWGSWSKCFCLLNPHLEYLFFRGGGEGGRAGRGRLE